MRARLLLSSVLVAGCPAAEVEDGGGSSDGGSTSTGAPGSSSTGEVANDSGSSTGMDASSTGCIERTWYPDEDGDGWGDANGAEAPVVACEPPEGWVDVPDDCDDAEPLRNPGQDELCDDGLDNDCDDVQDEWSPSNLECNGCVAIGSGGALYVCPGLDAAQAGYEHCATFGAVLASIHGGEDNDLLAGLMSDAGVERAYIGFVFDGREWAWSEETSDGSAVNYDNWADGFPGGAPVEEACAVMIGDGTWETAACSRAVPLADAVLCRDDSP